MDRTSTRQGHTKERTLNRDSRDLQNGPEVLAMINDVVLVDMLDDDLFGQGFTIHKATTYAQARRLINWLNPDVVLIDAAFSDEPAASVCWRVRERDPEIIIIVLAANAPEEEKLQGFEAGADDYLAAPFDCRELVARMKAKLRRSRRLRKHQMIEVDDLRIDPIRHEASLAGHTLALRSKEFAILAALASTPGTVWTRIELAREVW